MDYLDMLFNCLEEERPLDTPEYRENKMIRGLLMTDVEKAMGAEEAEKIAVNHADYVVMECRRYFRYGIRLGLELLGLLV